MAMDKESQQLLVLLPKHLHRRAKVLAAIGGRSMSDVVRELLAKWTAEQERKPGDNGQKPNK